MKCNDFGSDNEAGHNTGDSPLEPTIVPNTSPLRWVGVVQSQEHKHTDDGVELGAVCWEPVALPVVAWCCSGSPLQAFPIPMSSPLVSRAQCAGLVMPDNVVYCGENRFANLADYVTFVNKELRGQGEFWLRDFRE